MQENNRELNLLIFLKVHLEKPVRVGYTTEGYTIC